MKKIIMILFVATFATKDNQGQTISFPYKTNGVWITKSVDAQTLYRMGDKEVTGAMLAQVWTRAYKREVSPNPTPTPTPNPNPNPNPTNQELAQEFNERQLNLLERQATYIKAATNHVRSLTAQNWVTTGINFVSGVRGNLGGQGMFWGNNMFNQSPFFLGGGQIFPQVGGSMLFPNIMGSQSPVQGFSMYNTDPYTGVISQR